MFKMNQVCCVVSQRLFCIVHFYVQSAGFLFKVIFVFVHFRIVSILIHSFCSGGDALHKFLTGYQSYIVLTTEEILIEVENSSRIISYYLITYGLSFTIVAISLGIDPSTYTIKADACVWMEQNYLFYITFVLPCCIYILVSSCETESEYQLLFNF